MGARVFVTPGELSPATSRIRCLPAMKVCRSRGCRRAAGRYAARRQGRQGRVGYSSPSRPSLELRSTVGHGGRSARRAIRPAPPTPAAMPATNKATMSDASPAREAVAGTNETKANSARPDDAKADAAKEESAPSRATGTVGQAWQKPAMPRRTMPPQHPRRSMSRVPQRLPTSPRLRTSRPTSPPRPRAGRIRREAAAISETAKSEPVKTETPKLERPRRTKPAEAVKPVNGA